MERPEEVARAARWPVAARFRRRRHRARMML